MIPLDAHLRQRIRQARDQAVRQAVAIEDARAGTRRCAGCGTHLDDHTPGCHVCWDRHRNRRRGSQCPCGRRITHTSKSGLCPSCANKAGWAKRRMKAPA